MQARILWNACKAVYAARMTELTPAVFLDRDGTLMHDSGYVGDPALVEVYPGVPEALARLKARGF